MGRTMANVLSRLFGGGKAAEPREAQEPAGRPDTSPCQVCGAAAPHLDTVDLNKSCMEPQGRFLPPSGTSVHYYLCAECGFCFAPELQAWPKERFAREIYNAEYEYVDPDYVSVRALGNAESLDQGFGASKATLRHLDYGGGSGLLSDTLRGKGWNSRSYDPFVHPDMKVEDLGRHDLVTAYEVVEHVPRIATLLDHLDAVCKPDGLVLFSTLLSDGQIAAGRRMRWWYASPRNGHISLFSQASLQRAFGGKGWTLHSFNPGLHAAYRQVPSWAAHLLPAR